MLIPTFPLNLSTTNLGVVDPIYNPPANVLVAVVLVARNAAAVGVEEETMAPVALVVSIMLAPVPERVKDGAEKEEVAVSVPTVRLPMDDEAKNESTNRPMFANREVEVALVERRLGKVEVEVVVAVKYAETVSPTTESLAYGEVVPMPTFESP